MNVTELREQTVALVPRREALGHIDVTLARVVAVNRATALNVYSDYSHALAGAIQTIVIG